MAHATGFGIIPTTLGPDDERKTDYGAGFIAYDDEVWMLLYRIINDSGGPM